MSQLKAKDRVVGTLVGESTSREFLLAVTPESVSEQDIIVVEATLLSENKASEDIYIWAKVQRIERINPLFPEESAHELALTQTNPFSTVLSMSREMVTATCQVLGYELKNNPDGKLKKLRYPPKPATQAYKPGSDDIARILIGQLSQNSVHDQVDRTLDIASLSNRPEIDVRVDGHAVVSRHLAILAMTGMGKSWTARRIIEQLSAKHYPIVIFDPHGEYAGLQNVSGLSSKVEVYKTKFPIFSEDADKVVQIIDSLSGFPISNTARENFDLLFKAAKKILDLPKERRIAVSRFLKLSNAYSIKKGENNDIQSTLYFFADFVEKIIDASKGEDLEFFADLKSHSGIDSFVEEIAGGSQSVEGEKSKGSKQPKMTLSKSVCRNIERLPMRMRSAAKQIRSMEEINIKISSSSKDIPSERTDLVQYNQISVISLAGYDEEAQCTIYSLIVQDIFSARIQKKLKYPVLLVLEEGHNFVPAQANGSLAKERSIMVTKQIAQEGRKFNIGLMLISQRPSRLDETTLAMCNSYVIMRMMNPADQSFVRKVVESLGEEESKMLPDLEVGEAILSGQFTSFPVLVKMKEPESKGEREEKNSFDLLEEEHRREF